MDRNIIPGVTSLSFTLCGQDFDKDSLIDGDILTTREGSKYIYYGGEIWSIDDDVAYLDELSELDDELKMEDTYYSECDIMTVDRPLNGYSRVWDRLSKKKRNDCGRNRGKIRAWYKNY